MDSLIRELQRLRARLDSLPPRTRARLAPQLQHLRVAIARVEELYSIVNRNREDHHA